MNDITIPLLNDITLCPPKIKHEKEDFNAIQENGDVISEPQGKSQLILTSMFYNTLFYCECRN